MSTPQIAALVTLTAIGIMSLAAPMQAAPPDPAATTLQPGQAEILKWPEGKKAAFLLQYDDSCPTHLTNAIPELQKRELVGTFYIIADGHAFKSSKAKWQEVAKSPYVVLGNHTFTHKGVKNAEELEPELVQANEAIKELLPDLPTPRLIAFAKPGGVPWEVSKEEVNAALGKHHLIARPPFSGPPLSQKTLEACLASIDTALEKGEMGHLDFHGVGGDWHVVPMDWYTAILDKLVEHRADIWVTDPVSWHKYVTERESAKVNVVENGAEKIVIEVKSDANPTFYDQPLTLAVGVPAGWQNCAVTQAGVEREVTPVKGTVRIAATPSGGAVTLRPR